MEFNEQDKLYMQRALQLASLGGVSVAPNPLVGAVIVWKGRIIGEGYHQKYGEAHAEVNAVNAVKDLSCLNEATIYVTLEPCSHHGKTPPCADLIVRHKFKRVVVACIDTYSEVAGRGIERMQAAGIQVDVGLLEDEAREVNKRFFTYHEKKRPYISLKWAQTQDGFIDRLPQNREEGINWITTPSTKLWVHQWRSKEQAILVGVNTILNDNPQLNVRKLVAPSPIRIVLDPNRRITKHSTVLNDGAKTILITKPGEYSFALANSVDHLIIEDYTLPSILKELYALQIASLFVEGGAFTINSFIKEGVWDEAKVLTGRSFFLEGILAPILKVQPDFREELGEDVLHFFRNR